MEKIKRRQVRSDKKKRAKDKSEELEKVAENKVKEKRKEETSFEESQIANEAKKPSKSHKQVVQKMRVSSDSDSSNSSKKWRNKHKGSWKSDSSSNEDNFGNPEDCNSRRGSQSCTPVSSSICSSEESKSISQVKKSERGGKKIGWRPSDSESSSIDSEEDKTDPGLNPNVIRSPQNSNLSSPSSSRSRSYSSSNSKLESSHLEEDLIQLQNHQTTSPSDSITVSLRIAIKPIIIPFDQSQTIPCMIKFKCPEQDLNARAGVDIVCVIDVSGSMSGKKLKLVKQTLLFMIKRLSIKDRVSFITFSTKVRILSNLLIMSDSGKEILSKAISGKKSESCTNIIAGIKTALDLIASRKTENQLTSIILLTDGMDDNKKTALTRFENVFSQYNTLSQFNIHTFGYGCDHQADLLNLMASKSNGGFYYIENENSIPKVFSDCLGEMMTVIADSVQVELITQPGPISYSLAKVYSESGDLSFKMPPLLAGETKETVFLLTFSQIEFNEPLKFYPIIAKVEYKLAKSGEVIRSEHRLRVICKPGENYEVDVNVMIHYYRGKCADVMKGAADLADQGKMMEGRELVTEAIEEFKECIVAETDVVKKLISELENVLPKLKDKVVYNRGGKAELRSKANNHFSKRCEYKNSVQERLMEEANNEFDSD